MLDLKDDGSGWSHYNDSNPKWARFSFGQRRSLRAIYCASFENVDVRFTVRDDASNAVANVTMTTGPFGWALPIRFATPLVTSNVLFEFGAPAQAGMREFMFFEDLVPPPPSGTCILLR